MVILHDAKQIIVIDHMFHSMIWDLNQLLLLKPTAWVDQSAVHFPLNPT